MPLAACRDQLRELGLVAPGLPLGLRLPHESAWPEAVPTGEPSVEGCPGFLERDWEKTPHPTFPSPNHLPSETLIT